MKDEQGKGDVKPPRSSSFSPHPSSLPLDLKTRTREFALRVITLCTDVPNTAAGQVIAKQLLRSGTSVGAQYREGCRARSDAEFVSKLDGALQELEESEYWMELLVESGLADADRMRPLMSEADELAAILVTCVKKVKARKRKG